jgi:hypothetical protein
MDMVASNQRLASAQSLNDGRRSGNVRARVKRCLTKIAHVGQLHQIDQLPTRGRR